VGNENSNAQNNEKGSYGFKHRSILCNPITKRSTRCTVKKIPSGELNFPVHDDFEQHLALPPCAITPD
jgi:hypothetical protein